MQVISVVSFMSFALAAALLLALLLTRWKGRVFAAPLTVTVFITLGWAILKAFVNIADSFLVEYGKIAESMRDFAWIWFLSTVLKSQRVAAIDAKNVIFKLTNLFLFFPILSIATTIFIFASPNNVSNEIGNDLLLYCDIAVAIGGLVLVEQIIRNRQSESHWSIKYIAFSFLVLFGVNLYFAIDTMLFRQPDIFIANSIGFSGVFAMALLGIGIERSPLGTSHITLSRPFVFYTTSLVIIGVIVVVIANAGYYFREYGGDWGRVLANTFIFTSLFGVVIAIFSDSARARVRVFIDKNFLNYRYDYREVWQSMIRRLSADLSTSELENVCIDTVINIVDSQGGSLWLKRNQHEYHMVRAKNFRDPGNVVEPLNGSLVRFLEEWQWVINVPESINDPGLYRGLTLPNWAVQNSNIWLIVPLMLQTKLYGFVVLTKSKVPRPFNWEDIDLLKTVGRQIAIYLAQHFSRMALIQSRQFEAFNRLSAYVMHDLKNLVSQLGLIVRNAEKHKSNPEFVTDVISTVSNAVDRMNRLLAQLRTGAISPSNDDEVDIVELLRKLETEKSNGHPLPRFIYPEKKIAVKANYERLLSVIGHVIQNAQDATSTDGKIEVSAVSENGMCRISVSDSGCGMTEEFINNRLFVPFDTTKGLTGMGIGAHDAKQFVESLGGAIRVKSKVGEGTEVSLFVPEIVALQK